MNEEEYDDWAHIHPTDTTVVEFVAYLRLDEAWDVYVFEPFGSCPELEAGRRDEQHIFICRIASTTDLDQVVAQTENLLGEGYVSVPYYRETGTRRTIDKIFGHLRKCGAHHMSVRGVSKDVWELRIRKKDVALAQTVVASNIGTVG